FGPRADVDHLRDFACDSLPLPVCADPVVPGSLPDATGTCTGDTRHPAPVSLAPSGRTPPRPRRSPPRPEASRRSPGAPPPAPRPRPRRPRPPPPSPSTTPRAAATTTPPAVPPAPATLLPAPPPGAATASQRRTLHRTAGRASLRRAGPAPPRPPP